MYTHSYAKPQSSHLEYALLPSLNRRQTPSTKHALDAKVRLLGLVNLSEYKEEITLQSQDKIEIFQKISEQIESATTLEACFDLYEKHHQAFYIIKHYWENLDKSICSVFNRFSFLGCASSYTNTKIKFINLLRQRCYQIIKMNNNNDVMIETHAMVYVSSCKSLLNHAIFADEHDKQKVEMTYKDELINIIKNNEDFTLVLSP